MFKKFAFIITLSSLLLACNKTPSTTNTCVNTGVPTSAEVTTLQNYLTTNSINATYDSVGFFYQVVSPGAGITPVASSTLTVIYRGSLLNGTVFDSTAAGKTASFQLGGLIPGWQLGIPLIKKGGSINLYLPPSLGYGCNNYGNIPGNSSLIFNIQLLDVQ